MAAASPRSFKVVIVGSSGVGKTALVQRLTDGSFQGENQSTVGVEFKSTDIHIGDEVIRLNLWDTAGQEKYRSVAKAYFRYAFGAILTFSIDSQSSFDDLGGWLNDLHSLACPNACILLVGNKSDLNDKRVVATSDAEAFAKRHCLDYIETSAQDGINVQDAFVRLGMSISEKVRKGEIKGQTQVGPVYNVPHHEAEKPGEKSCSC